MDKANISQSVIASLALKNKDDKYFYLADADSTLAEEYGTLHQSEKSRFLPLICGFDPTDPRAAEKIERTIKYYPNIWHGIGEILFRHDELSREMQGEHPRLNNPSMKNVYQLCRERKMPMLIHQNLNSDQSFPNPEALKELEETLDQNNEVVFIIAHAGTDIIHYNPNHTGVVRELLFYHENLCLDLSWKIFDKYIFRAGNLDKNWISLTQDFSDRICLGSDDTENPEDIPKIMIKFDILLNALDKKAQMNLAYQTAYHLYNQVRA